MAAPGARIGIRRGVPFRALQDTSRRRNRQLSALQPPSSARAITCRAADSYRYDAPDRDYGVAALPLQDPSSPGTGRASTAARHPRRTPILARALSIPARGLQPEEFWRNPARAVQDQVFASSEGPLIPMPRCATPSTSPTRPPTSATGVSARVKAGRFRSHGAPNGDEGVCAKVNAARRLGSHRRTARPANLVRRAMRCASSTPSSAAACWSRPSAASARTIPMSS